MKNKIFSVVLVLISLFLSILWMREQSYRTQLKQINKEITAVEDKVRLLGLRTDALEMEVELLDISNQIKLLKGWRRSASHKSVGSGK